MINKLMISIVIVLVGLIGLPWLFNHVDPWFGILMTLSYLYALIKYFTFTIKNKTNEN